ncbi:hypothetical protein CTAYLR_003544 [Chrysophaeum taylorii]|uniref:Uncharacterized protein n=1 Tax=Chrysophaeum taylorii TaxID=2483200 RepID=A0AAD7ULI5_9STRA|nr:hypothetical protein CTAYLR_003544 [Chrysophaeum taylorii]
MAFKTIDVGFLATALFFNTMTAPMVKLTQNDDGGYDFNKWCVYFFSELIKLAVALAWCVIYHKPSQLNIETGDFMQYAVPGFVFFAQNNLSFLALQHMDSSAFQLLMNTRIISVALLSVLLLRKPMNTIEWLAIVLLMVGAMQYQLSGCEHEGYRIDAEGLLVMLVIVLCAAGGNVYTQRVMQKKMDQPLMLQNSYLYLWGIFFNGINWSRSVRNGDVAFGTVGSVQVFSMVFYAVYGLSISIILKRFGAITRTFINTAAIVLTALVDVLFFRASISVLEMTTFVVISIAVFLHTVIAKQFVNPALPDANSKV